MHARTLFNTGASHLFISRSFAREHDLISSLMLKALRIQTYGHEMSTDRCIMSCSILFGDRALLANLVLLPMREFDMVLGMDWLTRHHATIDCDLRTVTITTAKRSSYTEHVRAPLLCLSPHLGRRG